MLTAFQALSGLAVLSYSLPHEEEEGGIYPSLFQLRVKKPLEANSHYHSLNTAKGLDSQEMPGTTGEANTIPMPGQFSYLQSILVLADWLT